MGSESQANGLFGLKIKHLTSATPSDEFIVPPVKKTFILIPEILIECLLYVRPCAGAEDAVETETDHLRNAHTLQVCRRESNTWHLTNTQ